MELEHRLCHDWPLGATITIISTRADDPDSSEKMILDERRFRGRLP